jgi:hypothetical protein
VLDILVWLWHDPHLQGSRGVRNRGVVCVPEIRQDMLITGRRARKMLAAGKKIPDLPLAPLPRGAPSPPRAFKPEHVNRLAELFKLHLPIPHRFVCIADDTTGFSDKVTVIETPAAARAVGSIRSPEGNRFPSCYRRLWAQSEEAKGLLSERVLLGDIDMLPVNDLSPIVDRAEPFVGWRPFRDWGRKMRIGGGLYLFTPGAHQKVWTDFVKNPHTAIAEARVAGLRGSDQAWLSYKLADKVPVWGRDSGLYSIRDFGSDHKLPADAKLVQFNGPDKMWAYRGPASWVAHHWRGR